ncbi:uncharacterized protein [Montipora foliosa]|uniref:uncharacterized protein n=1 Tax=Montipora foliosa TaxID=591990 RepID=UPI0035F17D39
MKFVALTVLVSFFLTANVDAASVSLSSNELTLTGNAEIRFLEPREEIWNGLSNGHRFPLINSGDIIALRSASTSSSYNKKWLYCTTSSCVFTTCPGTVMTSSHWSSCSNNMKFVIRAKNKMDGQPINSGDAVSIISMVHGSGDYRLRCSTSTSWECRFTSTTSPFKGNHWLYYYHAVFEIFSRNGEDGTPLQYGDIVGFKYPFGGSSSWLHRSSSNFYALSCSSSYKWSCATTNTVTGFKIFKKL